MANWSGISAALSAIVKPSILQPRLSVSSIASLDFPEFKRRGIVGVVIDKDNCITKPLDDDLAEGLRPAWTQLLKTFGPQNVLIVSNSAGTRKDPLLLQAEAVSRNLLTPVLIHPTPKPGFKCVESVADYFLSTHPSPILTSEPTSRKATSSFFARKPIPPQIVWSKQGQSLSSALNSPTSSAFVPVADPTAPTIPKILVIGDRVTTDMILAQRINRIERPLGRLQTISILTTTLHASEGLGTKLMRVMENSAIRFVEWRQRREQSKLAQVGTSTNLPDGGETIGEMPSLPKRITQEVPGERWEECLIMTSTAKQVPTIIEGSLDQVVEKRSGWRAFVPLSILNLRSHLSLRSILAKAHQVTNSITRTLTPPRPEEIEGAYKTPLGDEYRSTAHFQTPTQQWRDISGKAVGVAEEAVEWGEKWSNKVRTKVGGSAREGGLVESLTKRVKSMRS